MLYERLFFYPFWMKSGLEQGQSRCFLLVLCPGLLSDPLLPPLVCLTSPYRNPVPVFYVCSLAYCVLLRFALLSCSLIFSREQFRIHLLACSPFSEFTASPYVLASCFCVAGFGVCHLLDFILELDALRTLWV